ncbi:MAG: hypothetical protein R2865_16345 [Deinococcales bacterium]
MMMGEDMMHDEGQMMSEDKMDESHDMIAEGKEGDMMHEDMMGEDMMGEDMMHGDMMSHDMMDMSKLRYELHVYDAGSEANNESCTYIRGLLAAMPISVQVMGKAVFSFTKGLWEWEIFQSRCMAGVIL